MAGRKVLFGILLIFYFNLDRDATNRVGHKTSTKHIHKKLPSPSPSPLKNKKQKQKQIKHIKQQHEKKQTYKPTKITS